MKNKAMLLGLFFVLFAVTAHAAYVTGGLLSVNLAKYEPSPVEAGKYATIYIDVDNIGIETVENAIFTLETKYPFTIPDNDSVRTYSRITGLDDIRLEYKVYVDKNAKNSTSEITVKYSTGGAGVTEKKFVITVKEGEKQTKADLSALFVDTRPAMYPGGTSKISLDIVNLDDGTAYHALVKAETAIADIKRSQVFIGNLEGDDFDSVDFDMTVKNVAKGVYPVDITMTYKDSDGAEIVQKSQVYVNVLTKEEALMTSAPSTSSWMYIIYIIVIIVLIRALLVPFVRWFVKPFRKKKSHQ